MRIDRLKELRLSRKLTQDETAIALEIPRTTYAAYEQGKREPDDSIKLKMATFFNVSTDYLLGHPEASVPKHIDVEDIVNNQAMLTSRNHALSDEDRNAIRALLTTYLNSAEGQDRLRKFGGYGDNGKKQDESD